jgi:cellulose synthase/poly-beta-1,6-N-acetylglucosamine synthase-like glycosyltransferase
MISSLLNTIFIALKTLAKFLTVLLLGLIATLLIVLPWLLRTLALFGWLVGTFLLWLTINNLYSSFTPTLPLFALAAVPAIISTALVVWLFSRGQQGKFWGAMTLWSVIGWLVWKGSIFLSKWHYGVLVVQILPAALSAVLLDLLHK